MSWPSRLKILICVQVFFGLCNAIVSKEDILKSMSLEERKSIFGTEDGSISECEVVELLRSSRSKRSGKEPVDITFNVFGTFSTATLHSVEDDDLISRSRTAIWAARYSRIAYQNVAYDPWPHIFDTIGDFEFLQNVEEGSAVTRFWDSYGNEQIVGIVKQNYTVKSVSKEFEHTFIDISRKHAPEERSINLMSDQDKKPLFLTICKNAEVPQEYFHRLTYAQNDALTNPNLHRLRRQSTNPTKIPNVVHPKILVIPDFSTVDRYTDNRGFMVQLIAQLNFVDMMFRKLKNPEVHLNIAGIIIPRNTGATPYMWEHIDADNQINGNAAVYAAEIHFWNEHRRFPVDDWDSILMLTAYPNGSYNDVMGHLVRPNALNPLGLGCSGAAVIGQFTQNIKDVFNLAYKLSHIADSGNCSYSPLRKIPDAVKSMPGSWLSIAGQCDNLYNDATGSCMYEIPPECFMHGCVRNHWCDWTFDPPLQGTLLLNEYGLQACINNTMVPV